MLQKYYPLDISHTGYVTKIYL